MNRKQKAERPRKYLEKASSEFLGTRTTELESIGSSDVNPALFTEQI